MQAVAMRCVVLAFLLAPAVPAALMLLVQLLRVPAWEARWAALTVGVLGYIGALLIGVPIYLYLHRKGVAPGAIGFAVLGLTIGVVVYLVIVLPGVAQDLSLGIDPWLRLKNMMGGLVLATVSGAIAGGVFAAVAGSHRG